MIDIRAAQVQGAHSQEVKRAFPGTLEVAGPARAKARGEGPVEPAAALPVGPVIPPAVRSEAPARNAATPQTKPNVSKKSPQPALSDTSTSTEPPQKSEAKPAVPAPREKAAARQKGGNTDAEKTDPAGGASSTPPPPVTSRPAAPTSYGSRTMTRVLGLKIGRIVLDPGHGGHDTGSVGKGGLKEKDLVLEVAYELQKLLEKRLGAEVVMTRSDDTFVPLEERTAMANQAQADLFVSIHANSSPARAATGVETYYLNFARTDEARELAARENATTARNVHDLEDMVKKIAAAEKSAESRELASILQQKLYGGAQRVFPGARNRGVRTAPFVVLIGANMPSVLAEVGFVSNPRDEKLLKKEAIRQQLVQALYSGIEGYMKTLGREVAQR
jgi:N-acetylmuramoyl-L-alanine amidase